MFRLPTACPAYLFGPGVQVWEPGTPPQPESPPLTFPPTDLFPEQRIAVYRITQRQQQDVQR